MRLYPELLGIFLLLASACQTEATDCSDDPCENGGQCEDVSDGFKCLCPVEYFGDRCQYELKPVSNAVCIWSSPSLNNDSLCDKAVDGTDNVGLDTAWTSDGTYGSIGAAMILNLVNRSKVIAIKYLQLCDPEEQFSKMSVTLNDGTMDFVYPTCSTTDTCSENWEVIEFDPFRSDVYLVKITVLETCSGDNRTSVGFRDITVLTPLDECTVYEPCQHGGVCIEHDLGYSCNCSGTGYEGDNCETMIDNCIGVECENGGSCVNQLNGYICACADGTEQELCTDPADLQCKCSINATTLELDVFDEPDLMVYSTGQKTILSSYKLTDADPCKFKFQSVTVGPTAPAPLVAVTFNIGVHPRNDRKTAKSYKMWGPVVKERGLRKKDNKVIDLPYCWNSTDYLTQICIERVGDIIQFRSSTCQYALDVDVSNEKLSGATLYVDQSDATELIGMCGDCDGADNGYVLYNGTSVDNISDITERYQLITESYLDWVAKRSKRSQK